MGSQKTTNSIAPRAGFGFLIGSYTPGSPPLLLLLEIPEPSKPQFHCHISGEKSREALETSSTQAYKTIPPQFFGHIILK